MAVKAKFRCRLISAPYPGAGRYVELSPVYAGPNASEEDKAFWNATPNGKLEMSITNPYVEEFFQLGSEYYLTFEPAILMS